MRRAWLRFLTWWHADFCFIHGVPREHHSCWDCGWWTCEMCKAEAKAKRDKRDNTRVEQHKTWAKKYAPRERCSWCKR